MATTSARIRLLTSATVLMRSKGADGFGMSELVAHSGVARRSMYQHFPDGKAQLLDEATAQAGRYAATRLAAALDEAAAVGATAAEGVAISVEQWKQTLITSDYEFGCPLVAASTAAAEYPAAARQAAMAFATLSEQIAVALRGDGLPAPEARRTGEVLVAAMEGAVLTARALRSVAPLDALAAHIRHVWG